MASYIQHGNRTRLSIWKQPGCRLPKEFRVASEELEISRRGDEIVLREKAKVLARAFEILSELPDDFLPADRGNPLPQARETL